MNKAVVAVALAAICLAAGLFRFYREEARLVPAAQLVSPEALLLVEFPDLSATAVRWRETALCDILGEPEVQAFLAKPRLQLEQNKAWAETMQGFARIQPRQAFLAVERVTNPLPSMLGGFAFGGNRGDAEALLAKARAQMQSASPGGKRGEVKYREFQIETFSDKGITLAGCFARNWYFVANDLDLLKSTLDRLTGKTLTHLAATTAYRESLAPLPPNPDFRLFTQPGALSEKLLTHLNAAGQPFDFQDSAALRKMQAVALATRLEGQRIRDALYLYEPQAALRPVLSGKTLELTTPDTLFYGAMSPQFASEMPQRRPSKAIPGVEPLRALFAALAPPAATLSQFNAAFGPEHALLMDWPTGVEQPNLFLALEVRRPEEARKFMESVFRAWNRADNAGVCFWTLTLDSPAAPQFHPTVALTAHHAMAALNLETLKPFAANATSSGSGALPRSPAFLGAMSTVTPPQTALAYLDAQPVFERLYALLRPAVLLWGLSDPEVSKNVDFGKLPSSRVFSRHLSPLCLSASQTGRGLLVETTGPVTFIQMAAGIAAMTGAVLQPPLAPVPLAPGRGFPEEMAPFPPAKPLSTAPNEPSEAPE